MVKMIMFRDAFIKLERDDVESILHAVNPALDGSPFESNNVAAFSCDLPFYPGYRFLEISNHSVTPPVTKYMIYRDNDVTVLDWSNEPIYALNARLPIVLDKKTVCDYVRFFFSYVRGKHGRFLVTETVDDIYWKEEPPPAARRSIGQMLEPVHVISQSEDGTYNLAVRVMFKDSLFNSVVHVSPGGFVSLSDEELLVEDMPVLDDTLGL